MAASGTTRSAVSSSSRISRVMKTFTRGSESRHTALRMLSSGRRNSKILTRRPSTVMASLQGTSSSLSIAKAKAQALSVLSSGAAIRPVTPFTEAPILSTWSSRRWALSEEIATCARM